MDSDIRQLFSKDSGHEVKLAVLENKIHDVELKVQAVATKIAIYSSLGAFAGGGLVSIIIGFFFKK